MSSLPSLNKTLDYVAIVGYSFLFAFALSRMHINVSKPVDLAGNILLLVGLAALIRFHYYKITTEADVQNSVAQKNTRIVAHSCIVAFFVTTLISPLTNSKYRFYDNFGLLGHALLLVLVTTGHSQLIGVGLLAVYFFFGTYQKFKVSGMNLESMNMVGRLLLLAYFSISFGQGVHALVQ